MRITSKSRHAITSMFELMMQNTPVKLAALSDNNGISLSYLEQIFAALRAKGLVKGQRGPGGGYVLAKNAADISIADIIRAVDEWVDYAFSRPKTASASSRPLSTHILWDDLSQHIYSYLSETSLLDVAAGVDPAKDDYKSVMKKAA